MRISKGATRKVTTNRPVTSSKQEQYDKAVSYIKSAMNCLNSLAKENDEVAKDAIVNMSVVAFDLKGSNN